MELLNVRSFVFSCMLLISIYNQHEEYTNEEYTNSLSNRIMNTSLVSNIEDFIGYRKPSTVKHTNHRGYHTLLYLSFLLLLNASDVETNPGPRAPKHHCQICKRAVTWKERGVTCDDCSQWYHAVCMHITSPVYWAIQIYHGIVLTVGCLTSQRHCSNPLWSTCPTPMTIYQTQTCPTTQASQSLHHHH